MGRWYSANWLAYSVNAFFVELLPGTAVDEELERGVEQSAEQHHDTQMLRYNLGARRIIGMGASTGTPAPGAAGFGRAPYPA